MRTPVEDPARGARSSSLIAPVLVSALVASALIAPEVLAQSSDRSLLDPVAAPSPKGHGLDVPTPPFEPVAIAMAGMTDTTNLTDLSETSWDVPGQIVVDARDDLDPTSLLSLAKDFSLSFVPTRLEASTRIEIASVRESDMASLLDKLSRDPRVEFAEPLARVRASFVPNDPRFASEQWHMERIGATRAWDFTIGRGVTVAVVDTGIACEDHGPFTKGTDLNATECVAGWNFVSGDEHANDDQGHGTHVAGTIAQSTNNGIGASGVAFGARLMPVKVLNESGWGTTADVADGIRWAADNGAHVINLSLGGPRNSRILQKAIDHAVSRGAVVVAAAGNTGGSVQFPGASDGVIGVSATDSQDKLANFSSRGEGVDIAAPGVKVVQQTVCNNGRNKCEQFPGWNGTSMASPHVAGAAALMMSLGVTDPAAVEDALRKNARVVDDSDKARGLYGAGVLDAGLAAASVTKIHAIVRLIALALVTLFVGRSAQKLARKKNNEDATNPLRLDFLLPALATGPGLFFFAPWFFPRVSLAVDALARPVADMDLFVGVSLHRFLLLGSALLPFLLTAVLFGVKKLRPTIAGFASGTAAYMLSVIALGDVASPFGRVLLVAWCALNAAICAWIARTNLAETR